MTYATDKFKHSSLSRRTFIANTGTVLGAAVLLQTPIAAIANSSSRKIQAVTVGQIMDAFIKGVPGGALSSTVDTLKAGSRDTVVTGIVTTMFATIDVIKKAIAWGANFIIAHEPTFYNHQDETSWLESDDVYQYKIDLIKKHNITIWRNHDYIHSLKEDGVYKGVIELLGWQKYAGSTPAIYDINPSLTLKQLVTHTKQKLNINMVRYIGDPNQQCKKVLLLVGAAGGKRQIEAISKTKPDVVLCGEISEWETAEYVRDARAKGDKLSLVVLGHIASEEPGSIFMASWIREKFPEVKVTHIPAGNSLSFM